MKMWNKYIFVFLLTLGIFGISWYISAYFNQKKITEIKDMQNKVSVDILSSETQFALLEEMSCTDDLNSSILSSEIGNLADKITYSEQNVSASEEILMLKNQYTILQVKDFLLTKRIGERCKKKPVVILYFYANKDDCEDCQKQGYVLDAIRSKYPEVRVYSFDYNLDLSTLRAMKTIYKINEPLPAVVVNDETLNGFQSIEEIEAKLPTSLTKPETPQPKKSVR